jgi:hypothetical protein
MAISDLQARKTNFHGMAIEAIEAFGASVLTMEFRRGIVCSSM